MANTKISFSEGTDALTGVLLNIAELEKNTEYTRLAYCGKVASGTTDAGKPFFKFNLFDKGGHAITGRIFNVENVESKGVAVNNLANTVVKIRFSLSTFGGVNSLTILSIDPVAERVMSREEFIGELPNMEKYSEYLRGKADIVCQSFPYIGALITKYNLLSGVETVTMPDMWAERKGGAIKFTYHMIKSVEAAFEDDCLNEALAVTILSELFMYWKYAANYEEDVLSLGDNINTILAKTDKYLDAVLTKANEKEDRTEYNICRETKHLLKCYFEYMEPTTYLTHSLCSIRNGLLHKFRMQEENESMLVGTYKTIQMQSGEFKKLVRI